MLQKVITPVQQHLRASPTTKKLKSSIKVWSEVAKLNLSAMVVLSSGCGFILAGPAYDVEKLLAVTIGTSLAAASASAFNQAYEKETDKQMHRTRHRPIACNIVSQSSAIKAGIGLGACSFIVLGLGTNPITTSLGMLNIFLYSGVYTPLKQKTEWNTWIGAVVGAIPPVMGYAAATGVALTTPSILLGSGLFLWQFPHFFALSWFLRKDYARGGHKMVPCSDPIGIRTGNILLNYSLAISTIPFAAYALGTSTFMFPLESIFFNGYFVYNCYKFKENVSDENARKVFKNSLWYLPVFMGLFLFHSKQDRRTNKESDPMVILSSSNTILDRARNVMKDFCLHERMVVNDTHTTTSTTKDDHPGFCPVTKVEAKSDQIKTVLQASTTATQ